MRAKRKDVCQNCRSRKLAVSSRHQQLIGTLHAGVLTLDIYKCDGKQPQCLQCIRRRIPCSGYEQEIVFINAMTHPTKPQTVMRAGCEETHVDDRGVFGAYILKSSHPALCALSNLFDETTTPPEASPNELEDDVDFIVQHFAPICSQAPAEFNLYHNQICGAWVEMLPLVVEPAKNSPFLYSAIRTMATALRNRASATRGNESRILLMYGESLRRVGKALEEAKGVFQHEHCVAILCLSATNVSLHHTLTCAFHSID